VLNLAKSLEIFFSPETKFELAFQYMSATKKDIMSHVKDCQHFAPNTFPYLLYKDEVEFGNPPCSHKGVHKIGMLYISSRCFPTHMYSKLGNIILYTAVPSEASKELDVLPSYCISSNERAQPARFNCGWKERKRVSEGALYDVDFGREKWQKTIC